MAGDDYDAVIIGSGAGGGASAYALTRNGLRVLLLEAGPRYDPAKDYTLTRDDWERLRFPHKVNIAKRQSFAPLQKLSASHDGLRSWNHVTGRMTAADIRQAWGYHHVVGLGGSTLHYTGEAHRLNPAAMNLRTRFGVGANWPVDYAELEPFYCEAERIVGVAGPAQDRLRWRSQPCPLPPHHASYASQAIGKGCRKLGMGWEPNYVAALSRPYDGRPGCNYCGNCNRGCPRFDKGSVDITFIKKALESGRCRVQTECPVTLLEAGPNDRIKAIHYRDADGVSHRVAARIVVLAAGAVESPRLLLASRNRQTPDGLANDHGQVGKHFMETLGWVSSALHPDPMGSHRGLPTDSICWDFNAPDAIPDVVGGCRFSPAMAEADLVGPLNYARRVVRGWGKDHKRAMRSQFGRLLSVLSLGESLPNPKSFIDLDPAQRDAGGVPLARIHSFIDGDAIKRLEFMAGTTRKILEAAGADSIVEEYGTYDTFASTHVFGSCRMGSDPRESVVDANCRSHRWRDLFVVDGSVFPSSGGGEAPSLTIEALALRAGEHIARTLARRES